MRALFAAVKPRSNSAMSGAQPASAPRAGLVNFARPQTLRMRIDRRLQGPDFAEHYGAARTGSDKCDRFRDFCPISFRPSLMSPGDNSKPASLLGFREMGRTGAWPGEIIIQRSAKFCPKPCHDLRLTFQSELEHFQRDLCPLFLPRISRRRKLIGHDPSSGLWCAQGSVLSRCRLRAQKPATKLSWLEHAFCSRRFRF